MKPVVRGINPKVVYIGIVVLFLPYSFIRLTQMPDVLATHWGSDGSANGWMLKEVYFTSILWMIAFAYVISWFLAKSATWQKGIHSHELPSASKLAFESFMQSHSWYFGLLLLGYFLGIHAFILWANTSNQPAPNMIFVLVLTLLVVCGLAWWFIALSMAILRLKN